MQTSQQDNTNVLFTAEVTKIIANSKYAKEECDGGKEINTDQMIACSLLLTPDMIHVIKIEEDAQECAYTLEEVDIIYDDSDPTTFLLDIESNKSDAKGYNALLGIRGPTDELHPHYVSDRVVQFVMESGAHCAISDVDGDYSDDIERKENDDINSVSNKGTKKRTKSGSLLRAEKLNADKKDKKKAILFHASPVVIMAFMNNFSLAKAQKLSKGFEIL